MVLDILSFIVFVIFVYLLSLVENFILGLLCVTISFIAILYCVLDIIRRVS